MNTAKQQVLKRRKYWWTDPWVLVTMVLLLLIPVPVVLWIASYKSVAGVVMFVVTYICLAAWVLVYIKRSLLDPNYKVDEEVIRRTRVELAQHREKVKKEFVQTEIEVLSRGEKTPVLDVWRLNERLRRRHPFFSSCEAVLIDPTARELLVRIQLGALGWTEAESEQRSKILGRQVGEFLGIVSKDAYLGLLNRFFDAAVIELYGLREDENGMDAPYPILSLQLSKEQLDQITSGHGLDIFALGDCRFNLGAEIQPHRGIESASPRGLA